MGAANVWRVAIGNVIDEPINCDWGLPTVTVVYNVLMSIVVLIHVIIALSSVAVASFTFFKPTIKRLAASYGFIVATVASGTFLILSSTGSILRSCITGLFYVTVVSIITIATHVRVRKQAQQEI